METTLELGVPADEPLLLTIDQVVYKLGVSEAMVYKLKRHGLLDVVKIGRCSRYHHRQVEAMARNGVSF